MNKFLKKLFPDNDSKFINKSNQILSLINEEESHLSELTDDELKSMSLELKSTAKNIDDSILIKSFSIVREASKRVLGMRHFDVQIIGGLALNEGNISEMKTGEGKTLVATLPAYLNAICDQKVHVVTVNDYLAKRDASWMGEVFDFLGLSIGFLQNNDAYILLFDEDGIPKTIQSERKKVYECDIVYGTNSEFGFDYLRDNMIYDISQKVQSGLDFAIVDEVDNILIDEARTPLIISGSSSENNNNYLKFASLVNALIVETDFEIDEKSKSVYLTENGINKSESSLNISNLYDTDNVKDLHFLENALKAKIMFEKNKDYVVNDRKVILVDEFTGRLMPGRRYSDGLHQAIEAKERVPIQSENITQATITLQNFFRMYSKLSGMTGTAATESEELMKIYGIEVVTIPTNMPGIRNDLTDYIFKTEKSKYKAVINDVKNEHSNGRPILIGTTSIEKSEIISNLLKKEKIPHQILNAKNHEKEASVISEAGKFKSVTVATNMAGRGTDIILGGSEEVAKENWDLDHQQIVDLGGLYVIGTERHEARRIDNQLRGRSGRQGDPGSSRFFVSLEDELMNRFGGERIKGFMEWAGLEDDVPIENKMITKTIENAQVKIESYNFDIRKHLVKFDDVTNTQRDIIYTLRKNLFEEDSINSNINQIFKNTVEIFSDNLIDFDNKNNLENQIKIEFKKYFGIEFNSFNNNFSDLNKSKLEDIFIENLKTHHESNKLQFINIVKNDFLEITSNLCVKIIDYYWINHLTSIENLRQGVGLQSYAQKDPLMAFKQESLNLFEELIENINVTITKSLMNTEFKSIKNNITKHKNEKSNVINPNNSNKIKRNDPCPCGCGLKVKKCPNGQLMLNS
jgi:preprotein translocase subunit SecA